MMGKDGHSTLKMTGLVSRVNVSREGNGEDIAEIPSEMACEMIHQRAEGILVDIEVADNGMRKRNLQRQYVEEIKLFAALGYDVSQENQTYFELTGVRL